MGVRGVRAAAVVGVAWCVGACSVLLHVDDLSSGSSAAGDASAADGRIGGDGATGGDGSGGDDGSAIGDGGGPSFDAAACTVTPCAVQLAAAGEFTCALLVDHSVRCWGRNLSGQLGTGTVLPDGGFVGADSTTPVAIANVAADEIGAGGWSRYEGFVCARRAGTVSCWGNDTQHELGRGNYDGGAPGPYVELVAAPVTGLDVTAAGLVVGAEHACVIGPAGELACWGDNFAGALGRGPTPTPFSPAGRWSGSGAVVAAAAGRGFTCVATAPSGTVTCFGADDRAQSGQPVSADGGAILTPTVVPGLTGIVELSARADHTCARSSGGGVACWGRDLFGQLGGGPVGSTSPTPVQVTLPARAVHVGVGGEHSCAVLEDGTVWCWGRNTVHSTNYAGPGTLTEANFAGQIGLSPTGGVDLAAAAPRQVKNLQGRATGLALGYAHTCAILEGGSVACWGTDRSGQLGRAPAPFDAGTGVAYTMAPSPVPALVAW